MLKYRKLKVKENPDSLLSLLLSIIQLGLMLLGLLGLAVHMFEDNGWLNHWLGALFKTSGISLLIGLIFLLVFGTLIKQVIRVPDNVFQSRVADMMILLMMLLGLYFVYRLVVIGSF